jgi:nicotinic acid mononucleotide adenylyltransferase
MEQYNCAKFFFGRFQPPHSGHFNIIRQTVNENRNSCKIFIFVSPKTSRDDINKNTYGQYESEDRYPLTVDARADIIKRELINMGLNNVEVLTNARSAQSAIKEIIKISALENQTALSPGQIQLMLGEDEEGPFKKSFYGKSATNSYEDIENYPEKYVDMHIYPRSENDLSATKIRNRFKDLIISLNMNTSDILKAIKRDPFLDNAIPNDEYSRRELIKEYSDKMKLLIDKGKFGRYSGLAIGGKKTRCNNTKNKKMNRRKSKNRRSKKMNRRKSKNRRSKKMNRRVRYM